jgi:hypothetical protein
MKPAFHPSHTPWKSLRGFPHYHGYGDDYHVSEDRQSQPKTRNQSHSHRKGLVNHVPGLKRKGCPGTLTPSMSFVNGWAQGFLPASMAGPCSSKFLWDKEPGNVQRQSLKLPYAGWLPHERVSSQVCLGLSAGVGSISGPRSSRGSP